MGTKDSERGLVASTNVERDTDALTCRSQVRFEWDSGSEKVLMSVLESGETGLLWKNYTISSALWADGYPMIEVRRFDS